MVRNVAMWVLVALATMMWAVQTRADVTQAPVGKPAPTFTLTGTDGKTHSLADYKGKIVVLHFHSIKCPWAVAYQPILATLAKEYAPSANASSDSKTPEVVFLGINSNASESMDSITANVKKANLPYIVLKDPHNKVADAYGAITTPHIFVIDPKGVLAYEGGIEKSPDSPSDVGQSHDQYLKPVLAAMIAGKPLPETQTIPMGCGIRREKTGA